MAPKSQIIVTCNSSPLSLPQPANSMASLFSTSPLQIPKPKPKPRIPTRIRAEPNYGKNHFHGAGVGAVFVELYRVSGKKSKPMIRIASKWNCYRRLVKMNSQCQNATRSDSLVAEEIASFSITKAFILANTLMLVLPPDGLAETCEADGQLFNMPLLLGIALIGATVGGLLARQRKGELARVNDQLRQINAALRRQAKIESYAPNLSYAPVGRIPEAEVIVDPRKHQLMTNLRSGKNYLRQQDPEKAYTEFKIALDLAETLGDHIEAKKAARGLGASLQRQGKYKDAIKYYSRVLKISDKAGDDSGTTDAYGAIADCYTELGDLERAGKFYDKYIARLETN